jgi:hypothetical protein
MQFSPQPSYQHRESNSQFCREPERVWPIHFESISLSREEWQS